MKKFLYKYGSLIFISAVIAILLLPVFVLLVRGPVEMNLLVVDKSIPIPDYRDHESLFWTLNHFKVRQPGNRTFDPKKDYLGSHPEEKDREGRPLREKITTESLNGRKALFIADSYGVYEDDLKNPKPDDWSPDFSPKIYGEIEMDEIHAIEQYVSAGGSLITEFNTFATPTGGDARKRLEDVLNLDWTGWSGRFFRDLADIHEVPAWARRNYRKIYSEEYAFKGPGWMMTHESGWIVVLQSRVDIRDAELEILVTKDTLLTKGLPFETPYYYWFDVVTPRKGSTVPAWFRFMLTKKGAEKLAKVQFPEVFPAIVIARERPLVVYGAGDFSDNGMERGVYWYAWKTVFQEFLNIFRFEKSNIGFFWGFYVPYVRNIISVVGD